MGFPRPIDVILNEAKEIALGLGIDITGNYKKDKNVWYFEITNSIEKKWRSLGALKRVKNHFNRSTINEQLLEVKALAISLGLVCTGNINGESGNKRKFELSNGLEFRWSVLSNLRSGKNPFSVKNSVEQFDEAIIYANKLELNLTGKTKKIKKSKKYEITNGSEFKWISKEHLKEGKNPFLLRSIADQEKLVNILAKQMGLIFTGKNNGKKSNLLRFELTDGKSYKWSTLNRLENKHNPFLVPTIEEQCERAAIHAKVLNLEFTGNSEKRNGHYYFEITDGIDFRWSVLGNLRKQHNPFKDGGFDGDKSGIFYILKIKLNENMFVGYGISNNAKSRINTHKFELKKANGMILDKLFFDFKIGKDANNIETIIKRSIPQVNIGVRGFITECADFVYFDNILKLVTDAHATQSS